MAIKRNRGLDQQIHRSQWKAREIAPGSSVNELMLRLSDGINGEKPKSGAIQRLSAPAHGKRRPPETASALITLSGRSHGDWHRWHWERAK
jgi:hypothetical protein